MNAYSTQQQEMAAKIGQFYLRKNNGDYQKTAEEIEKLKIRDIEVSYNGKTVYVRVARVGLFIGRKGENIDKLTEFLDVKIHVIEVESIENWLIPQCEEPSDYLSDYMDEDDLESY